MESESRTKTRGRPKRIHRDAVIRHAFDVYWEHGVQNVPLTRVAEAARVNRVSVYHEFGGEENLLLEVLKFYKQRFQSRVNKIDEKADLSAVISVLFKCIIFDGVLDWDHPKFALFKNDSCGGLRSRKHLGCFYLQTKLVRDMLCDSHRQYFDQFDRELVRRLTLCLSAAQKKKKAFAHLDCKKTSQFLVLQLGLVQSLRKSNASKQKMLDVFSLIEAMVIPKKYRL
jgi:AcrR family transcriptional regulator